MPGWLRDKVLLPDGMMGAIAQTKSTAGWARVTHAAHDLEPQHVLDVVRDLLGEMSLNLSDGNTEVFAEITPPAAVFVAVYGDPTLSGPARRAAVLAKCDGAPTFEGVNHLAAGYGQWCDAMEATDPVTRSQAILAGSLHLGTHEQNHLQPQIAGSMNMGVQQAADRLRDKVLKDPGGADAVSHDLDVALDPAAKAVGDLWYSIMTTTFVRLDSPEGALDPDFDVPAPKSGTFTPSELAVAKIDELATMLKRFDRSDGNGKSSRAIDWAKLDDRMNYILNLFKSRHHEAALFDPPFDQATLDAIMKDQLPAPGGGAS
jgi:hypothetical protein